MASVSASSEPPAVVLGWVVALRTHRRARCQARGALWPKPEASGLSLWAVVIAAGAGIVVSSSGQTAKQRRRTHALHRRTSKPRLASSSIRRRDHDSWDLFLDWPIDDPHLEAIRQECVKICRECPPVPGKDINEEGETRAAALLADLRRLNPGSGAADALSTSQ